jgi:hypothetical protein
MMHHCWGCSLSTRFSDISSAASKRENIGSV